MEFRAGFSDEVLGLIAYNKHEAFLRRRYLAWCRKRGFWPDRRHLTPKFVAPHKRHWDPPGKRHW